jgi:hypothetical protein
MKQETKQKISNTMKSRHYIRSAEHKQAISSAMTERSFELKSLCSLKRQLAKARKTGDMNLVEDLEYKISVLEEEI